MLRRWYTIICINRHGDGKTNCPVDSYYHFTIKCTITIGYFVGHLGACQKCCQPITLHCYCGKQSRESICAEEQSDQYSCGKRCSR